MDSKKNSHLSRSLGDLGVSFVVGYALFLTYSQESFCSPSAVLVFFSGEFEPMGQRHCHPGHISHLVGTVSQGRGLDRQSGCLPKIGRGSVCVWSPMTGRERLTFLRSLGCVLLSSPTLPARTGVFSLDDIWNLLIVVTLAYICIPYANQAIYF